MTIIPFPETSQGCSCKDPEWLTLPVAPQAIARSSFCGEEKLPQAVPIDGALTWIADLKEHGKSIAGLDIYGPGDPLATWTMTRDILIILREEYPSLPLGITTLGIGLAEQTAQLVELGVSRVTLLVDAVNPQTVQNLYTWIRPGKRNIPLTQGADILVEEQAQGIVACKNDDIEVSIRTTIYSGVNEMEIERIADKAAKLGAESMTLLSGKGWLANGEKINQLPLESMDWLAMKAGQYIKAVWLEAPKAQGDIIPLSGTGVMAIPKPTEERPNVAVLSSNGMDIDLHLGQAIKALIYGPREDGLACLIEARDLPEPGSGDTRWLQVGKILHDCFALLATSAGQKPRDILGRQGLVLLLMEDTVEGTVDALFGGGKKGKGKMNI